MAFDWKNLAQTGNSQNKTQGTGRTAGESRNDRKKKKQREVEIEEQEYQKQYSGEYAGGPLVTAFDKSHTPVFRSEYTAVKSPQHDDKKTKSILQMGTALEVSLFAKETAENNRTSYNRYRVVLIKDKNDKVEDIMKKDVNELRSERLLEERKEASQRKTLPELALVSQAGQIEGTPVPVDKYLKFTKTRTLEEERQTREDKNPVFEAVYNREKNKLEHDVSYVDPEKAKEKNERDERDLKEKTHEKVVGGQFVRNEQEEMDLRGKLIRVNDERIDKDKWLFDKTGVNVDTTEIVDTKNIDAQKYGKLSTAREEEIDRMDEVPPSQDTPYSIHKESEKATAPYTYADPSNEFHEAVDSEEAQIYKGQKLRDIDRDGIGDKYEIGLDENNNGVMDIYEMPSIEETAPKTEEMSARERMDYEAEEEFNSLDFERERGTYGQ